MRIVTALVLALALGGGLAACKQKGDPAACKTSTKSSDECNTCCKNAGVSGYMWNGISNTCTCM
jgi:hypothetical protein